MSTPFNDSVIAEFRANEGRVAEFAPRQLILLHSTGAKSGRTHVNPLMPLIDGERFTVLGGNAGAKADPDWVHNLRADSAVFVETPDGVAAMRGREVTGAELEEVHARFSEGYPAFSDYVVSAAPRTIPAFELAPREA